PLCAAIKTIHAGRGERDPVLEFLIQGPTLKPSREMAEKPSLLRYDVGMIEEIASVNDKATDEDSNNSNENNSQAESTSPLSGHPPIPANPNSLAASEKPARQRSPSFGANKKTQLSRSGKARPLSMMFQVGVPPILGALPPRDYALHDPHIHREVDVLLE